MPTTSIYTLSLHDALPISPAGGVGILGPPQRGQRPRGRGDRRREGVAQDRKSTRLNSSHLGISYAVFCLKKKKRSRRRHKSKGELSAPEPVGHQPPNSATY